MRQAKSGGYSTVYVTRYMGAKYKLVDLVAPAIERLASHGGTVIDLMAGTQTVGYALKKKYKIISNDVQAYSEVFGKALLVNRKWSSVKHRVRDDFRRSGAEVVKPGWFTETYGDTYFSQTQCLEIESIRSQIEDIVDPDLKSVYLLALCSAMALCQSSPGHFAQYMPSDHPRVQTLRSMSVRDAFISRCGEIQIELSNLGNHVLKQDAFQLLESQDCAKMAGQHAVVYLDPPYTSAQYSRYYHLLETIVLNDQPEVCFKGLYRPDRYQSPFCAATRVADSFREICSKCSDRGWPVVISYSSHGLIHIDELIEILGESYPNLEVEGRSFKHSMQGRGVVNDRTEYVLTGSL